MIQYENHCAPAAGGRAVKGMVFMELIKGADLSFLPDVERRGGVFRDEGQPLDPLKILKGYGINWVRLRLWNDPYDENGADYGGGVCDLPMVLAMAGRAKRAEMKWLLDIQYSDFWTDPGVQMPPKAWQELDERGLEGAVYRYTRDVLCACRAAEAPPDMVQVGNELTSGLLWPTGRLWQADRPRWGAVARYLTAGVRAVREEAPQAPVVIHLDHGGKNLMYREWFDHYFGLGGDCDIIGLSYYPCWHETMAYRAEELGYPMTVEGQAAYIRDLSAALRAAPEGPKAFSGGNPAGCRYPAPGGPIGPVGSTWASPARLATSGPTRRCSISTGTRCPRWRRSVTFEPDRVR